MVSEGGSVAAEWHSHLAEEGPALFIRAGRRHNCDVHASDGVDLVEGDLREDDLLSDSHGVVPTAIETFRADASKIPNAGQRQVDEAF